jgi:enterochelin esterase family protein
VIFLYKGQAESVTWSGVFNGWNAAAPLEGRTIGNTDLWVAQTQFPLASRVEYKIVLNGKDWILDPANQATVPSGKTVNNVLVLPGFVSTDESDWRPHTISGTLSGNIPIVSRSLGYSVNYRVYTPADYENLSNLPVLYVLDGSDFIDPNMGALPNVLNNMLAEGRIRPVIAVFIDPYDPGDPTFNRREKEFLAHSEEFARFVATEIVPAIDAAYRTDPRPDARIIQGVSYGGLSATFIAASYQGVFHNLAALSPSYWVIDNPEELPSKDLSEGAAKMAAPILAATVCGGDTGKKCPALPLKIFLTFGVAEWDVGDMNSTVIELQRQGYPVQSYQVREGHAWSAWRSLLDEMLINYLGK